MVATLLRRCRRRLLPTARPVSTTPRARAARRPGRALSGETGFTLVEFMIAAAIMTAVLGATITLATQIQNGYATQLDDTAAEQEARYALDWIVRDLRSAGSDPYQIIADEQEVWIDPNGGGDDDDSIRVEADINPPDGVIGEGEDITIALDAANQVITRQDNVADAEAVAMTDAIFTDLSFTFLDSTRTETATPSLVTFVRIQVTAQSRGRNFNQSTLSTEVRLRTR